MEGHVLHQSWLTLWEREQRDKTLAACTQQVVVAAVDAGERGTEGGDCERGEEGREVQRGRRRGAKRGEEREKRGGGVESKKESGERNKAGKN